MKGRGERRHLNLALQGGGSHGAFTWGVIDRLLEEETIELDGITGTGSGAINGAVLAAGFAAGGAAGARAALDRYWRRTSEFAWLRPFHVGGADRLDGNWNLDASPAVAFAQLVQSAVSPYQRNPLNFSPLKIVLGELLDIASVRASPVRLYASATNVRTGKIRVFEPRWMTLDALLAASCLPQVDQAVIIDGEPYWDGGLMGNPPIFPVIYNSRAHDILIVQLDPIAHAGVPTSAAEITDRLNEITFNANLMREMRAIAFVTDLLQGATGHEIERLRHIYIHMIGDEPTMRALGFASKFNTDLDFLNFLKERGRAAADKWLAENLAEVGRRSTLDLDAVFL